MGAADPSVIQEFKDLEETMHCPRSRPESHPSSVSLLRLAPLGLLLASTAPLLGVAAPGVQLHAQAVATAAQTQVFPASSWERVADPETLGYSAQGLEAVRAYAETIPTTGLLVVVGGRVLFEYGDVEEVSYLASVRKSILAMLYGNYVEDGTIDLEKTLEE